MGVQVSHKIPLLAQRPVLCGCSFQSNRVNCGLPAAVATDVCVFSPFFFCLFLFSHLFCRRFSKLFVYLSSHLCMAIKVVARSSSLWCGRVKYLSTFIVDVLYESCVFISLKVSHHGSVRGYFFVSTFFAISGVAEGGCYFLLFSATFCYFGGLDFFYFLAVVWAFAKGRGNEGLLTPASPKTPTKDAGQRFFRAKKRKK